MTQTLINGVLAVGLVVIAFLSFGSGQQLGGSQYEAIPKWFGNGVSAGLSEQFSVDNDGDTIAKSLTLTNSSATSTLASGCIQATATSSATRIKLVFATTGATSTFNGTAYWQYGTC